MNSDFSSKLTSELKKVVSKPVPVPVNVINIKLAAQLTIADFCKAFIAEGYRKNPLMAERVNLTEKELSDYSLFLISKRVEIINDSCKDWKLIKRLAMPCFIELVLTSIGQVEIREKGIVLQPTCDKFEMETEKFLEVSSKIEAFIDDLAVVVGAMPNNRDGDIEIMSMAIINDYVLGLDKVNSPIAEYIVWFLQATLEDMMFTNLYRVQYDDVKTIKAQIASLGRVIVG